MNQWLSEDILTSPTAKRVPSGLRETAVAAFILSLLVHVFEVGESLRSRLVCGVDGEKGTAESLRAATDLFLPSFAVFVGVDGVHEVGTTALSAVAVGRALKNLWEVLEESSTVKRTAAAPAVYAKVRDDERLSNAVGEETVVPMIRLSERPDS
jgi:hypothetical protein